MPEFEVRSTDDEGNPSVATESADSVEDIVGRLRSEGLQASEITAPRARRLFEPRHVAPEDFAALNSELAAAVARGVPLPGALRALASDMSGSKARRALEEVASDIEGGTDLASALSKRSDCFPPGYVALVRAGLGSGNLPGTLLTFADNARFAAGVRRRTIGAVAYPLLALFAATGLLALAGWTVVPMFADMFREFGMTQLSASTQFTLDMAPYMRWAPLIVLGIVVSLWLMFLFTRRRAPATLMAATILRNLPLYGTFLKACSMARFLRMLAGALKGGVPVPEAVSLAGLAAGDAAVSLAAERLRERIDEGSTFGDGIGPEVAVFSKSTAWMLSLGEGRGELARALEDSARLHEDRARRAGDRLPFVMSAIVIAISSMFLLGGMYSLFMPMVEMMSSLGA